MIFISRELIVKKQIKPGRSDKSINYPFFEMKTAKIKYGIAVLYHKKKSLYLNLRCKLSSSRFSSCVIATC